jgi:hypothetical protein
MEGVLADKSHSLILDALTRAAAEPGGLPLLGGKTGLFAGNAAGKLAAEHSKAEGLVRVVRTQARGKSTQEICVPTEKGLGLLLEQVSPRLMLEALVSAMEAHERQLNSLLDSARATQEDLHSLKAHAEKVLQQVRRPQQLEPAPVGKNGKQEADEAALLLAYLRRRHEAGTLDDCPLPELYQHMRANRSGLTMGRFHDLLRRLYEDRAIYLHPWTGPLYELPEPACALLVGHEVAYYASARRPM